MLVAWLDTFSKSHSSKGGGDRRSDLRRRSTNGDKLSSSWLGKRSWQIDKTTLGAIVDDDDDDVDEKDDDCLR